MILSCNIILFLKLCINICVQDHPRTEKSVDLVSETNAVKFQLFSLTIIPAKSKGKGKRKSKSVQAEKAKEEKQGGYLDRGNGYVPTGIHKEFLNFGILATKRGFR